MRLVPKKMSDVISIPIAMLPTPAIPDIAILMFLKPLLSENGTPNTNVITDIESTVPTPNNSRYPIPIQKDSI